MARNLIDLINSDTRPSFKQGLFQLAWDSTSLGTFKKCPRKYFYSIVLGLHPTGERVHLKFGILTHEALEQIDIAKAKGETPDLRQIIKQAMASAGERSEDGTFRPWRSTHASKNLISLIRTIVWYAGEYAKDSLETVVLKSGKAATELSFRFEFGDSAHGPIQYSGHFDKLATHAEACWVVDRKTATMALAPSYWQQFNPNLQFMGYTFAANVVLGPALETPVRGILCDAVQVGAGYSRFGRKPIPFSDEQLNEWHVGAQLAIQQAHSFAEAEIWPLNETACNDYGGCEYLGVCSKSPSIRSMWLTGDSWTVSKWDPLEVRGKE